MVRWNGEWDFYGTLYIIDPTNWCGTFQTCSSEERKSKVSLLIENGGNWNKLWHKDENVGLKPPKCLKFNFIKDFSTIWGKGGATKSRQLNFIECCPYCIYMTMVGLLVLKVMKWNILQLCNEITLVLKFTTGRMEYIQSIVEESKICCWLISSVSLFLCRCYFRIRCLTLLLLVSVEKITEICKNFLSQKSNLSTKNGDKQNHKL